MNSRTNIKSLIALTAMVAIAAVIGQPSMARGGGHGGGGHGGGWGHGGGGYYRGGHYGGGFGYPAYYAPAYNDYGYRGYAPYPYYAGDVAVGAAAGALIGGLLAPRYNHGYDY